ncbi:alpha-amylase family glycosyl hydrolase [Deinococcus roseus]|uniref:Fibronectin type-III domain-containing protein n=1 Tax=Deinococcus roseus TaxID=392414 RepID=A0ABQ2CV59_9DEIO|nr:alpha-amylase family glycosyl hydrolase [Deinococcus roseus]GGJ19671.1 hypothetical protein GCM10008938_02220 [Deinococcus roseus]
MEQPKSGNRQRFRLQHALASLTLALTVSSCNLMPAPPKIVNPGPVVNGQDVIYFALTDRFANGDTSNDNGSNTGPGDKAQPSSPISWHGGDFKGLVQKINEGYFEKLGVTAIWISPVYLQVPSQLAGDGPNAGKYHAGYHGYWAEDFFKVDPHFGTLDDLKNLVKTAHSKGLKIVQDMVVNHAGYEAQLVKTHPDWFHTAADCDASSNKDVDCALAGLPDFKQEKAEVTKFLNDSVAYWINELDINGIRMDTMKHVPDTYWKQFFKAGGVGDPAKIWTVGEVLSGDINFNKKFINDLGSPALFDFPLQFALKDNLSSAGGNLNAIASIFDQDGLYNDPNKLVTLVDNHDVKRFVSEAVDRGVGLSEARERLDLALSLIFTSRGTPSVYYGTEIGMIGKGDPYNNVLGESNREDMDFGKLAASTLDERIKALSDARKKSEALRKGKQEVLSRPATNGGQPLLAFRRTLAGSDPVVVLINNSNADLNLSSLAAGKVQLLGTFAKGSTLKELTGKSHSLVLDADGNLTGNIAKRSVLVLSAQAGTEPGTDATLPQPTNLDRVVGFEAVKLTWTPAVSDKVGGYRVYLSTDGTTFKRYNAEPAPANLGSLMVEGLDSSKTYTFKLISVGKDGREATTGPTTTAQPNAMSTVSFTVDARSQGDAQIQVRTFVNGENRVNLTPDPVHRGFWKGTVSLPIFKTTSFKFGNGSPAAKNSGYEGTGYTNREITPDEPTETVSGVYNFITVPAPDSFISGKVTSSGTGIKDVLLDAALDPNYYFALTYSDGTYYLPVPSGTTTDVTASKVSYGSKTASGTSGQTDLNFDLPLTAAPKYTVDGNLADWTAPKITVTNAAGGYDTGFGGDNIFKELRIDSDDNFLYLGYVYRASGNSAIVHLDFKDGGFTDANTINAWARKATFNNGIDAFVAQYQEQGAQMWVFNGSNVDQNNNFTRVTTGTGPEYTTEVAIPWNALGLAGKPAHVNAYAGVYGGDNYGAGDILPSEKSTPAYPGNTIAASYDPPVQRQVTFTNPIQILP